MGCGGVTIRWRGGGRLRRGRCAGERRGRGECAVERGGAVARGSDEGGTAAWGSGYRRLERWRRAEGEAVLFGPIERRRDDLAAGGAAPRGVRSASGQLPGLCLGGQRKLHGLEGVLLGHGLLGA